MDRENKPDEAGRQAAAAATAVEVYDFRKPGRPAFGGSETWQAWLEAFLSDFGEKWHQVARRTLKISVADPIAQSFDEIRKRLPVPGLGWEVVLGDTMHCLLVFPRRVALAMVFDMLGQPQDKLPDDRILSRLELTLLEAVVQRLIGSLADAWPEKDSLSRNLVEVDQAPHRSRRWDPATVMMLCALSPVFGEERGELLWIMPQAELEEMLSRAEASGPPNRANFREQMQQCLFRIPVSVKVGLGRARIPVSRLSALRAGDVVVLDRKINEPLPLIVAGKTKSLGWLGRVGDRQAFQIVQNR